MSKTIYDRSKFYVKHVMSINAWNQELPLKVIVLSWKKHLVLSKRINQFSSGKILDKSYNFRHGRSTGDLTAEYEKIFNNWLTNKNYRKKMKTTFQNWHKNNNAWRLNLISLHVWRKFYVWRNNNKVDSIKTERTVISHLFPWTDLVHVPLFFNWW